MRHKTIFAISLLTALQSCFLDGNAAEHLTQNTGAKLSDTTSIQTKDSLIFDSTHIAHRFDFPVGIPNASGYYNAQKFQENEHLGDDWNAVTGGNSDLGDPIHSIATGYVKDATNYGWGWGNVIRILHQLPNGNQYESLYAHCDTMLVQPGTWIERGEQIGTIGNANGAYLAHLHLEIRIGPNVPRRRLQCGHHGLCGPYRIY